jgi:PKD repeat protein
VYTVTLTVTNAGGSGSASATITAKPLPPVAHFAASPTSGQAPLTVHFTDDSTGVIDSWSWTFGDNQSSTAPSPAHQYSQGGTFPVALIVKNLGGSSSASTSIAVTAPPQLPTIIVSRGNQEINVVGSHFPPNAAITIQLTDAYNHQTQVFTSSTAFGTFDEDISVPGCTGYNNNPLWVMATGDGGATWSNQPQVTC